MMIIDGGNAVYPGRQGRRDSHMKGPGVFVVSLRGVNFRFWSHFECSGQNTIIFSRKDRRAAIEEILKNYIFSIRFNYSIHVV